ncbi:hypothetical protein O181_015659 [Austropuccinia psidii MF-1]|uniref:Reverse transcriptase domain-containing protein n=1 Tax=Austropuccinia psidii MF-1 TaxID=1389203 RepID=A0A9Q3GR20_9BASI|nr:hypothetical protein [Austropuccinia psidii MF-1]
MTSQSLLISRDEVIKEINDWDDEEEPEEIETVLKVVPPAYHQYLDIFFKVKAEKLALHCACDHHIELESLLPPVGVIYSLSYQQSETLQAYISENVEQGFIWPSSSSTVAPFLFVKKKDCGLCLCVDYQTLNAVTRKKSYPVPPMNQLLTILNGSTIFSKIDFHGSYNLLRIKQGDEHSTSFRAKYCSYDIWSHQFSCFFPESRRLATLPDSLSRWDNMYPERGVDFISKYPQNLYQLIKKDGIQESRLFSIKVEIFSDLIDQIQKEIWKDKD